MGLPHSLLVRDGAFVVKDGAFVVTDANGDAECCCGCPPEKPPCCCTTPPTCPELCNPQPPPNNCACGSDYYALGFPAWYSYSGSATFSFSASCSFPNNGVNAMNGTAVLVHSGDLIRNPTEYCQAFANWTENGSMSLGHCPGVTPDQVQRFVSLRIEGRFGKTGGSFTAGGKVRVANTKDVSDSIVVSFAVDSLGNINYGQEPPPGPLVTGGIVFNPVFRGRSLVGFGANGSLRVDRGGGWISNYVVSGVNATSGPWYPCGADAPAKGPCLGCGDRVLTG